MKTIIRYECEICRTLHLKAGDALACEAQGPGKEVQVGTIFGNASDRQNFYKGMTFVIAKNAVYHHYNPCALWAFRDNHAGDSLDLKDLCGGNNQPNLNEVDVPDRNHPTFKRAVAFLKKHKVKPYIWNGKESVPL